MYRARAHWRFEISLHMVLPGTGIQNPWARSIETKFPEFSVQNSMDQFGPPGIFSEKRVHLSRWTRWFGWTGRTGKLLFHLTFPTHSRVQHLPVWYFQVDFRHGQHGEFSVQ